MCLTVADALRFAGNESLSRTWHSHTRKLFASLGDHAAIEALLYNWAALRLHAARLTSIEFLVGEPELALLRGEIESATNYQRLAQLRSLDYLLGVATASHHILAKDYEGALRLLQGLHDEGAIPRKSNAHTLAQADLAKCAALLGNAELAAHFAALAEAAAPETLAPDDRALVADSLATTYTVTGSDVQSREWIACRDQALLEHRESIERLRAAMAKWMTDPETALSRAD